MRLAPRGLPVRDAYLPRMRPSQLLAVEPRGTGSALILQRPGVPKKVVVATNERGVDSAEWSSRVRARIARLREIERDHAETDDPAFIKIFGAFVAKHGHTPLAIETIERQRSKGIFLDQVRAASGHEEDAALVVGSLRRWAR